MKKPAFPNDTFTTQQEYFDFTDIHRVFGLDAYKLKKKLEKRSFIPYPKLNKNIQDD